MKGKLTEADSRDGKNREFALQNSVVLSLPLSFPASFPIYMSFALHTGRVFLFLGASGSLPASQYQRSPAAVSCKQSVESGVSQCLTWHEEMLGGHPRRQAVLEGQRVNWHQISSDSIQWTLHYYWRMARMWAWPRRQQHGGCSRKSVENSHEILGM